jgi:AraC-like DNA-binding protein
VILEAARQENPPAPDGAVRAVEAACLFMQEEFFRPLQIDEVAGHVDCSRSQLYSAFKKQTGLSPNDWLLRYRIQQAESLLAATNRTIEDIAIAVGFSSSPYFCTVFRKYTGSPPGAFRRRKKGAIEPAAE